MRAVSPATTLVLATALSTGCGARTSLSNASSDGPGVPEVPCLEDGSWGEVKAMDLALNLHAMVPAPGGDVVTFGGMVDSAFITDEITRYRASPDEWELVQGMTRPRAFHTATVLADGRVLVAGGYTGAQDGSGAGIVDAEIFDPNAGGIGLSEATTPMPTGRYFHDAARLPDGRVLIVGGYQQDGPVDGAVLFDPDDETWSEIDAPPAIAAGYVALAPHSEGAYVAVYDGVYFFDAHEQTWSFLHAPPDPNSPYLNVPRMTSRDDRFVVADYLGQVGAGDRDGITWGVLWPPDNPLIAPPSVVLPLCDSAVVLADAAYHVSFADASLTAKYDIGLFQPSGTVTSSGELFVSGGLDPEYLPTYDARIFR